METWAVTAGLIGLVVMSSLASVGWDLFEMRNRENWWWTCILLMEAAILPNHYLGAVVAMFALGLFQIGRSWFILRGIVIPVAGLTGAMLALPTYLTRASLAPILWSMVTVGLGLGLWGMIGVLKPERPWTLAVPNSWFGMWGIYEHATEAMRHICGQGNTLHLVSVASLTLTAAVGLVLLGHPLAWVAIPICAVPIVLVWWNQIRYDPVTQLNIRHWKQCGQAGFNLAVLGVALLAVLWPLAALALCGLSTLAVLVWIVVRRPWREGHLALDSGRVAYWKDAIELVWWPAGWKARVIGFGTSTWFAATIRMAESRKHVNVFTTAHNEYVQCLVEHGVIGLTVLCAYLGEALWRTYHGGVEGQAVFLLGVMVCGIASISFPWTFFHEYHPQVRDGKPNHEESWYGSPTLNVLCFVVALLAELIR